MHPNNHLILLQVEHFPLAPALPFIEENQFAWPIIGSNSRVVNASIGLDIDFHGKTGDFLTRFHGHFAPRLMRRSLIPAYKRRIYLFQRFTNLYPDSDTCKKSICAQF